LRNSIDFQTPDTPDGYHLRRQLEDRLGVAGTAKYVLTVAMDSSEDSVAIASDDTATRVNLIGSATWALRDQDGQALANGEVSMFVGYSTTGTTVATRAAEQDAHQRLSVALADQIVTRLIIAAPDF
jgi:LPS-assembly lipoprotein